MDERKGMEAEEGLVKCACGHNKEAHLLSADGTGGVRGRSLCTVSRCGCGQFNVPLPHPNWCGHKENKDV